MAGDPRMTENPFQSPTADARALGTRSGSRQELINVAKYQKGVLFCLLVQILAGVGLVLVVPSLPPGVELLYNVMLLGLVIVSTIFVVLLATNLYTTWVGFVLGFLTLMPCLGLLILVVVNGKATAVLRRNNIHVGFLGADLSQL